MTDCRKRFTTVNVLSFFDKDGISSEEENCSEDAFFEYVGVTLADSDDDVLAVRLNCLSEDDGKNDSMDEDSVTAEDTEDHDNEETDKEAEETDINTEEQVCEIGHPVRNMKLAKAVPQAIANTTSTSEFSDHDATEFEVRATEESFVNNSVNPFPSSNTSDQSGEASPSESPSHCSENSEASSEVMPTRGQYRGRGRGRSLRQISNSRFGRDQVHNFEPLSSDSSSDNDTGDKILPVAPTRRGTRGRGRGRGRGRRSQHSSNFRDLLPPNAVEISNRDEDFSDWNTFSPLREPGPHLPFSNDHKPTELDLFCLYINDDMLEQFVSATTSYAESKKERNKTMYQRFKRSPLDKDEILRYIGVLLLLSINSVRSYREAWNRKSSQVFAKNAFYGQGYPTNIITDDSAAEHDGLERTWPNTTMYLCVFHFLQGMWRWLIFNKNGIHKDDRQHLMKLVKKWYKLPRSLFWSMNIVY